MPSILKRLTLGIRYGFIIPRLDGMMTEEKCRFLWQIVHRYQGRKGIILEIGSWKGCSTTWLAVAGRRNKFKRLIAIDTFKGTPSWNEEGINTYDVFIKRIQRNQLGSFVTPLVGDSKEVVKSLKIDDVVSILHIDGDHEYLGVKEDINNYMPLLDKGGILILDDYDSIHPDVVRAGQELLETGKFKVIDTVKETPGKGGGSVAFMKI
jgi:predicted O-methyltransferase YrrM